MRKSIFLMGTLLACMTLSVPQAMAQKQGRVEKLLKNLNENELEKYQKNRDKLDEETASAFGSEIGIIDAMNSLWNQPNDTALVAYYECYAKGNEAAFPTICHGAKVDQANLRSRTDQAILEYLEGSKDKLNLSKLIIENIKKTAYPQEQADMQKVLDIREASLMESVEKTPDLKTCVTYFEEYPKGKYISQMRTAENTLLYHAIKKDMTEANFKAFLDHAPLQEFFKEKGSRTYLPEVCSLYDDYLYELIKGASKGGSLEEIRKSIDNYKTTSYLKDAERKHLSDIEYLNDSVDYELLKSQIKTAENLGLIKNYLLTHKYKEFRDKANALRDPFEEQVIQSSPTIMKFYSKGLLMKSNETGKDKTISTTYTYNDKNQPGSILVITQDKGRTTEVQTNMFYDAQGRCALEIQSNPKMQKEIYRRTRAFSPTGEILADSLKYSEGDLILRSYDKQGRLTAEKQFGKSGELLSVRNNKYDNKGRLVESQYQNMAPMALASMENVLSQKDEYEYNKYGYLEKLSFQKILGNNDKTSGSLIFLYDEYGNVIDSNSYYEYDETGRWIRKTDKNNPAEVERIQCIYK